MTSNNDDLNLLFIIVAYIPLDIYNINEFDIVVTLDIRTSTTTVWTVALATMVTIVDTSIQRPRVPSLFFNWTMPSSYQVDKFLFLCLFTLPLMLIQQYLEITPNTNLLNVIKLC